MGWGGVGWGVEASLGQRLQHGRVGAATRPRRGCNKAARASGLQPGLRRRKNPEASLGVWVASSPSGVEASLGQRSCTCAEHEPPLTVLETKKHNISFMDLFCRQDAEGAARMST